MFQKIKHSIAKRVTRWLVGYHWFWNRWSSNLESKGLGNQTFAHQQRWFVMQKRVRKKCRRWLPELTVQKGPLAGTRYADTRAVGSSLWPKLMGTYEAELHDSIAELCDKPYQKVFDIGYAEGFYLVGLGRLIDQAELIGYDINPEAPALCVANAEVNQIAKERLSLRKAFNPTDFSDEVGEDSLVVVDCEGFEEDVLREVPADSLQAADWLIEMHDHVVPGITERWERALQNTHDVRRIETVLNLEQRKAWLPEPAKQICDAYEQETLVDEGREAPQTWLVATRKAA